MYLLAGDLMERIPELPLQNELFIAVLLQECQASCTQKYEYVYTIQPLGPERDAR